MDFVDNKAEWKKYHFWEFEIANFAFHVCCVILGNSNCFSLCFLSSKMKIKWYVNVPMKQVSVTSVIHPWATIALTFGTRRDMNFFNSQGLGWGGLGKGLHLDTECDQFLSSLSLEPWSHPGKCFCLCLIEAIYVVASRTQHDSGEKSIIVLYLGHWKFKIMWASSVIAVGHHWKKLRLLHWLSKNQPSWWLVLLSVMELLQPSTEWKQKAITNKED